MKTPICPACKAKFSHSPSLLQCIRCGIPDEVVNNGPSAIARWKRKPTDSKMSKNERKRVARVQSASASRLKHRHGARTGKRVYRAT